jgi:L-asparaginase
MGIRTDARRNLISAVEIASQGQALLKKSGGDPELLKQVLVFFNDKLFQGNHVHKRSALDFDGFETPFDSPIAVVGTKVSFMPRGLSKTQSPAKFAKLQPLDRIHFETQIGVIHLTPGFPAQAFSGELLHRLLGLILVTFPSGTAPTHEPELLELVRRARASEVPVVLVAQGVAQAPGEVPSPTLYEAGRPLLEAGAYWSGGLTLECAYVKMAWALGQVLSQPSRSRLDSFAKIWEKRWVGEGSD